MYVEAVTPFDDEKEVEETQKIKSPPNIAIGTRSMQVDRIHITIDDKEDLFVDYGSNIVGNITAYSSSNEEDDEEEKKIKDEEEKKRKEEERREEE